MNEYLRPWKLVTFALGINALIWGAIEARSPDWDITISILMAVATYLTAPWSLRVVLERRWKWMPLAAFWTWLSVDGVYWAYNHALPDIAGWREVNAPASLSLYGFCAVLWLYRGSVAEFKAELSALVRGLWKRPTRSQ
ncbi:hypothetical protein QTI66_37615 [Variovorax sp. J22R133]|uniref:hypothetical protein n=1 Tax=Variovorax brevis TaxID=3053503 RepID=UPI00257568C2|nr:hypothetical protein [Variovorax sp. J22R133]MDM0117817.1 hypothetical protein [Variovorax sp. J22R133]